MHVHEQHVDYLSGKRQNKNVNQIVIEQISYWSL